MSIPLMLTLNFGSAALLALTLTALMLIPRRLRAHHHPHQERPAARPEKAATTRSRNPATERPPAARPVVTQS